MVRPLSSRGVRAHWLRADVSGLTLWLASAVLLSIAVLVALGWL